MTARFLTTLFVLVTSGGLFSQEIENVNPVIKIMAGEPYYLHEVLEGQTLDAIARAYATSVNAIDKENPALKDPLITHILIRIPYTDASASIMIERAKALNAANEPSVPRREKSNKDDRAMAEAASLIETKPTPQVNDEDRRMLVALAQTVSAGLQDLKEVEAAIEEKPYLGKDGLPIEPAIFPKSSTQVLAKGTGLGTLLDEVSDAFVSGDSLSHIDDLHIREYFLVRVNPMGVITNVRDERTLTNHNSQVLHIEDIKGRYLVDSTDGYNLQIVPVGLNLHLTRNHYPVRIKKGRIKAIKPAEGEDALDLNGEDHMLMLQDENLLTLKGKFLVEVVEGEYYLSLHDQFEYNPFGITIEEINRTKVHRIVAIVER